jgi:hypothetical protein
VDTHGDLVEGRADVGSPAKLAAGIGGLAQPSRRGQPSAHRAAEPGEGGVKVRRRLGQVERRLFDAGPRRQRGRVPGPVDPIGTMDDDARDRPRGGGLAPGGHRDVDLRARLVGQAGQFRRCFVTQHGIVPRAEQSGPEQRLPRRLAGEGGVSAPMQPCPPAEPDAGLDGIRRESAGERLAA